MEIGLSELIERLIIINLKIFKLEDIKRDSTDDKDIANATRQTNILNTQRSQIKNSIDAISGDTNQEIKLYGR